MVYCQKCGKEVSEATIFCPDCGCSDFGSSYTPPKNTVDENGVDQSVSVGLVILAFLIPLFGIIYWPVKAKTRPKCAKICGIVAIVSWVLGMIVSRL